MLNIGLQFFGGRGSGGGKRSGGGGGAAGGSSENTPLTIPKITPAQVNKLSRSQLETLAASLYVNEGLKQGLSKSEALYRARSLMPGNSDSQLRKYIKRRI